MDKEIEKYLKKEQVPEEGISKKIIFLVVLLILVLTIPPYFLFIQSPAGAVTDCGFNKDCFVRLADNCEPALYHQEEVGSLVRYETRDCELTVSFEKFAETESEEMKILFANKQMSCPFIKGSFDVNWIAQFIAPMSYCSGDLKEAIFALRVAQLSIT